MYEYQESPLKRNDTISADNMRMVSVLKCTHDACKARSPTNGMNVQNTDIANEIC